MQFTRLAIQRLWATSAIFGSLCVIGLVSYFTLPINLFPNVPIPIVTITTIYPGANPQEIEIQISRPIEDAVAGLSKVVDISSTSAESFSSVVVIFDDSADLNQIASDVERRVNTIVGEFPTGAERPVVLKVDLGAEPIMRLALVDSTLAPADLYRLAHDQVLPALESIGGVSQAQLIGGREEEIHVDVDPVRLSAFGVGLTQVQQALAAANSSIPGGRLTQGARQFDLQVTGRVTRIEDLGDIVVGGQQGKPVRVRDVATVRRAATEETQFTRSNKEQAILITLAQSTGTNLTDVTDTVRSRLDGLRADLPPSSQLLVVSDATPFIKNSLNGIQDELVVAVFLTAVVLLLFLHEIRAAAIVLLSIPTTLLTTFLLMELMGFSLNFLSMLGLTLTIGILVDDSIVVLENILRHLGRGEEPFEASLNGRAEIGLAAVAITLVDVVVFAPTGLVSGQVGGFFREFGFTIAGATLTSLFVSFTLTPMLAARFLRAEDKSGDGMIQRFGRWWDHHFERLEQAYRSTLVWSLRHRLVVCIGAFVSLIAGVALVATGLVAVEFVPTSDDGFFIVSTEAPPGTSLDAHDRIMSNVEQTLLDIPEVERVTASVGVSLLGGGGGQSRFGTAVVELEPLDTGRRSVFDILEDARARLKSVPGAKVTAGVQGGGPGADQQPAAIRISGPEFDTLTSLANEAQTALEQVPGLINVSNGAPTGQPQLSIRVDAQRASDLGVNAASLGLSVRSAFAGVVATKFQKEDGTLQDVRLQLASDARVDVQRLGELPVQTATGQTVLLRQVATIAEVSGPAQISRFDRERVVTVGADLSGDTVLSQVLPAVNAAIEAILKDAPPGYTVELAGGGEDQAEAFGDLFKALGASILLAYLLMAVLYNSFTHPLVILFSLPVAVAGAMFGLLIFDYTFSVFSMIGLILLVGLAIKNGILLVDRANHNRERGMTTHDALIEAGPARLRPILMTSITIALALFPTALGLGEGTEIRAPLAATVLGGVISSTALTLLLIPVVYSLFDSVPGLVVRILSFTGILALFPQRPPRQVVQAGDSAGDGS
ncbi:MAG: efflux RND transporter permease subunit [Dehalococcoidia bacterium]|nr:efflux RND transporter permease subunit [Dehalococcoidia bacterium]